MGIGGYAIALITTAPATLVDAGLQDASDGRLRLAEAQGSLWSGTGQLETRDARGRTGLAKGMAWRLRLGELLRARLGYEVKLDPELRPFPATLSWSRIEIANADISLPPAVLGYSLPKLAALELTGDMNLHLSHLSISRGDTRGNATLQWHTAGSVLSPVAPLGDYELRFAGEGPLVHINLRTLQGPLQLDGQGLLASGRKPDFHATAEVPPQFHQQLAPFLHLIAVEQVDGRFALQIK